MSNLRRILHGVLLGPDGTYHNASRRWLYAGFVAVVLVLIGMLSWRASP